MKRLVILWPVLALLTFYPGISNAAGSKAADSCLCNQSVTFEGTVIDVELTDNHYSISTNLTCGGHDYAAAVNIKGQGKPPSSCKKYSHFKASGTVNCDEFFKVNIIPSKIICD